MLDGIKKRPQLEGPAQRASRRTQAANPGHPAVHPLTSSMVRAPCRSRMARIVAASKRGSRASTERKNRSCEARAKFVATKTGWYSKGNRPAARNAITPAATANSNVISKLETVKAGQLL